jgi:hypothetical protein
MNRRSHQQVPQGTARTGSHIQNVTSNASSSSLIGDAKVKTQQKSSIPSISQASHHAPPAKRTRLATASSTVTSAKYDVSNDNSITGDFSQSSEHGMSDIDPLSVPGIVSDQGMQQRDPLMEESGVDLEEEQMITIDSIKSETVVEDGSLGMYGERSEDDDGTFEMTEHGEHGVDGKKNSL